MHISTLLALSASVIFTPLTAALPAAEHSSHLVKRAAIGSTPAAQLAAMLANPSACPASTGECVTPGDAVGPIIAGLNQYGILTAPEQAAVVSLMAFESVDFKYNHNVYPGRPGQGTRAMLMPNFVREYAADLPELSGQLASAGSDPVKVLQLVSGNEYSFAAASWFYNRKCSDAVKNQVRDGGEAGWADYLKTCVGVDATADRKVYWARACEQLSV